MAYQLFFFYFLILSIYFFAANSYSSFAYTISFTLAIFFCNFMRPQFKYILFISIPLLFFLHSDAPKFYFFSYISSSIAITFILHLLSSRSNYQLSPPSKSFSFYFSIIIQAFSVLLPFLLFFLNANPNIIQQCFVALQLFFVLLIAPRTNYSSSSFNISRLFFLFSFALVVFIVKSRTTILLFPFLFFFFSSVRLRSPSSISSASYAPLRLIAPVVLVIPLLFHIVQPLSAFIFPISGVNSSVFGFNSFAAESFVDYLSVSKFFRSSDGSFDNYNEMFRFFHVPRYVGEEIAIKPFGAFYSDYPKILESKDILARRSDLSYEKLDLLHSATLSIIWNYGVIAIIFLLILYTYLIFYFIFSPQVSFSCIYLAFLLIASSTTPSYLLSLQMPFIAIYYYYIASIKKSLHTSTF